MADTRYPQPTDSAEALERLGRLSLRELSMDSLLQAVADLAKQVMPGNPEASVCLLVKDRPTTVVSTDRLATELDETQYDRGHGPCMHAARTGELTEIRDTRSEDQAKGILMERHKLTADQAFQLLAGVSMNSNRKVRDVADHLVTTGELPLP